MESDKKPSILEPEGGEYRGHGYQRLTQYDQPLQHPPYYGSVPSPYPPPPPQQSNQNVSCGMVYTYSCALCCAYGLRVDLATERRKLTLICSTQTSNVVVVAQPSAQQPGTVIVHRGRPDDYLVLVLCLMVVCFCTGNLIAFVCLIPALILSLCVSISITTLLVMLHV